MTTEILEKFERLRSLREWVRGKTFHDGDGHEERREEIDTLAADLEAWARRAEAGEVLDRVCEEWAYGDLPHPIHRRPSTDRFAAMVLLEAMPPVWSLSPDEGGGWAMLPRSAGCLEVTGGNRRTWPRGGDPMLAIARACAVLAARGIERGGEA